MKIGTKKIDPKNPTYVIAEAGINHNGDIKIAKKMIIEAAKCGADAIKFQSFTAEELFSKKLNSEIFDFAKKLSLTLSKHKELKKFSEKYGIDFISTATGIESINILKKLKVKCIKIASMDLSNHHLLSDVAKCKIPLILSTGMSTISEIKSAVEVLDKEKATYCLLHCISSYPTSINDANLNTIPYFYNIFSVPIGYSDHTLGIDACITSIALGSCIIEKHFTLDKNMSGPDQKLSADPTELKTLVNKIRIVENLLGKPRKNIIRSEMKFRKLMHRSIGVSKDIKSGSILKSSMLKLYRPGTGIPPNDIDKIIGRKVSKNIDNGSLLDWNMF